VCEKTLSFRFVVRKFGLSESIVEITIKEDYFIVKKIGEKLEGSSSVDEDEENKDYTIQTKPKILLLIFSPHHLRNNKSLGFLDFLTIHDIH